MSFQELAKDHPVYGNVSSIQRLHLLLSLRLEEHDYKDHERKAAELAQVRMNISRDTLKWEGYPLYKPSGHVDYD